MFWDYIEFLLNSNTNTRININLPDRKKKKKSKQIQFVDLSDLSNFSQKKEKSIQLNTTVLIEEYKEFIKELKDPITGDPIEFLEYRNLYRCRNCTVLYLKESFEFLLQQNHGKCVSCGASDIEALVYDGESIKIQRFDPEYVTLDNYTFFVGRSVKFYGKVIKILQSRRGDYALMFEDKPWVEGFKLVVFYPIMNKGKGLNRLFLESLMGKEILVRGLLKKHEIYGYEILIFKRNMILDIK